MKCFYHSADLDGHCSGMIVKYFFPKCELYPIDYGKKADQFPWDKLDPGETVFMVDFSLQPFDKMIELNNRCRLIWIDHHNSAIREAEKAKVSIAGQCDVEKAACELCWSYLTAAPIPQAVYYLGRFDMGAVYNDPYNRNTSDIIHFQYGMRICETDPRSVNATSLWRDLFVDPDCSKSNRIKEAGKNIVLYQQMLDKKCTSFLFTTFFEHYKALVINRNLITIQTFAGKYDHTKHDLMIGYVWTGSRYNFSVYTTHNTIDVGELCKKYGGGGHKKAGGFSITTLPFSKWAEED